MHNKLTLRIEESLIQAAKKYSKAKGKSVSQLIADYLYLLTGKLSVSYDEPIPPLTKSLKGILHHKKVAEADYKKYLEDKYK